MLENHFGIVSTQTRKDFLASSWKEIQEINPEQSLFTVLNQTYKLCRKKIPEVQKTLEVYLESPQKEASVAGNRPAEQKERKPRISNEELISEIKNQSMQESMDLP